MKYLKFKKENDGRWFVVLPEWTGSKSDLEMVCGADTMLEIIAQGENKVELSVNTNPFPEQKYVLTFDREENAGAWYNLKSDLHEFEVWLCYVTKFVFEIFPKKIYIC